MVSKGKTKKVAKKKTSKKVAKKKAVKKTVKKATKKKRVNKSGSTHLGKRSLSKKKSSKSKIKPHINSLLKKKLTKKVKEKHGLKGTYEEGEFNPFDRVPSGIPGFDQLCEGGFAKNSINLLGGDAGSGKSLFAMQFIMSGINDCDEPGVYISFEESRDIVFERMKQYGWDLATLEDEKKFVFLQYTPEQVEQVLESGGGIVADVVESIGAKRVVFDSLTAFTFLFETEFKQRSSLLSLFSLIRKWGCTALLIAEEEPDIKAHKANIMEFESDADILIYNILMENKREHVIEIYKMRGTNHMHNIYPMTICDEGVKINSSVFIQQM